MKCNADYLISGYPTGVLINYIGLTAPRGCLSCDGSSKLIMMYPQLFTVIGYTFGGSGPNFNVPDSRGRVVAFKDGGRGLLLNAQGNIIGGVYGLQNHKLELNEMPTHNHGLYVSPGNLDHYHDLPIYRGTPPPTDEYGNTSGPTQHYPYGNNYNNASYGAGVYMGYFNLRHGHTAGPIVFNSVNNAHNNLQPLFIATKVIKL